MLFRVILNIVHILASHQKKVCQYIYSYLYLFLFYSLSIYGVYGYIESLQVHIKGSSIIGLNLSGCGSCQLQARLQAKQKY